MSGVFACLKAWCSECDGATAVEYGLIAAGIALAIAVTVFALGDGIIGMFDDLTSYLTS